MSNEWSDCITGPPELGTSISERKVLRFSPRVLVTYRGRVEIAEFAVDEDEPKWISDAGQRMNLSELSGWTHLPDPAKEPTR
jgi:hypothetical protein